MCYTVCTGMAKRVDQTTAVFQYALRSTTMPRQTRALCWDVALSHFNHTLQLQISANFNSKGGSECAHHLIICAGVHQQMTCATHWQRETVGTLAAGLR